MGWTGYHRIPGESDRDHLQRELFGYDSASTIVDSVTVHNVFYGAVRNRDTGECWALVVLQQRRRGYENYFRKEVSEDMGPGDYDCPDRILDLLTPTDSEWANQWRAECRKRNAAKARRPKVRAGQVVRFTRPLTFTSGVELDTFRFVRGSTFSDLDGYRQYRITSWRERDYSVEV